VSELITHTAVYEDCARLALISPRVCGAFKTTFERHADIASLGCLTRGGDRFPVQLLEYCRDHWESRREGDFVEEKLAFTLGWRCHNAADRHFKPIYRKVQPEYYKNETGADADEKNASDARIYHDLIVYREVYDCGKRKGFSPYFLQDSVGGHPAAQSVAAVAVEAAMGAVIQRSLLGLQSFAAKETNPDAWLKRFDHQRQDFYIDLHRFARGIEAPPPDWLRRFILENNFYDRRDPLIRLARALHQGARNPDIGLDQAVEQAAKQSQYAQALRKAYLYITACSEFFERKIGEAELRPRLDLGTPHVIPGGKKK
jgi:hypothetical protein